MPSAKASNRPRKKSTSFSRIAGLLLVAAALIISYEFVLIGQWRTLTEIRRPTTFQNVTTLFGAPDKDIGSGLHIYRYNTLLGHMLVGTPDNDQVIYIRYSGLVAAVTQRTIYGQAAK